MISGITSIDIHVYLGFALFISMCYLFLILTSGIVLKFVLSHVSTKKQNSTQDDVIPSDQRIRDTGFIVGKCENILIPTLILLDAYTALAIIFTAKTIVRAEDMKSENTLYFLAGTMVNFTYSLYIGVLMKAIASIYF
jgi:tetrahydromethanopterin S-methyltransferase subunit B